MKILGLDTALRTTGYGIIEVTGKTPKVIDCGLIKNKASLSHSECMKRISLAIQQLIETFHPDQAVIEGGFYYKNAKTAMVLGMARGAVVAEVAKAGIPIFEYAPKTAKLSLTGSGSSDKKQVAFMVANILNTKENDVLDASDALSLTLCHLNKLNSPQGTQGVKEI